MSANPIDKKSTPDSTGSLEDLFRHHLGEEAAVPPRPLLWDQIDNSLLIRQNETYRRRLVATRWVAAASLLLATLAGTGWWASRYADSGGAEVATTGQPANHGMVGNSNNDHTNTATGATATAGSVGQLATTTSRPATSGRITSNEAASAGKIADHALAGTTATTEGATSVAGTAATAGSTGRYTDFGTDTAPTSRSKSVATSGGKASRSSLESNVRSTSTMASAPGSYGNTPFVARTSRTAATAATGVAAVAAAPASPTASRALAVGSVATSATAVTTTAATSGLVTSTTSAAAPMVAAAAPATAGAAAGEVGLFATHPAALSLATPAPLPNSLATMALPADAAPVSAPAAHKWNYGASYTAGIFNPNINFSRAGIEHEYAYNPALGADSPALTEAAATEYRQNLRPGLSQRLALLATRHLAGHWLLRTGAEFTQATAKSASTAGFVGEQLYDLGQYTTGPVQTTNFRYRSASIPVELRYANATKHGWSLYGRLGGVVSALLGVRSEVTGNPEATRTYSFLSDTGPYRRLLASVRGGAGAQFSPTTGNWTFTLGPVAEMSLMSLNAHPAQSYLAQSHPYSFGIEAGMQFGR